MSTQSVIFDFGTRNRAYKEHNESGAADIQREMVYEVLCLFPEGMTRQQLRDICRIEISSVCGRVNELLKQGRAIKYGRRLNPSTKKHVEVLLAIT